MGKNKGTKRGPPTFADVREIALSMPDVEETTAYGMPAFKAGKARFAGQPIQRAEIEPHTLGVMVSFEERELLGTAWRHAMERQRPAKTRKKTSARSNRSA